jgi:ubiquinone biosynthesis protein COQ9
MVNKKKEIEVFTKLKSEFKNETFFDLNIKAILKRNSISEEDFYYFFPNKTKSLCSFFLIDLQLKLEKKIKNKIKSEKSISKRVNFILFELIKLLNGDKAVSLFFLNYISRKPIYLKKITIKFADRVWRLLEDKSVDFNYYTKRMILSQILINSILYWRGSNNLNKTEIFIEKQIFLIGKFGYYKSNFKKFISEIAPKNFFTKFDFLH